MKSVILGIIRLYRKYLSPNMLQCCRFYPSCSEYAILSVEKYGIILGLAKALKRIFRCHPFSRGGYDPVV